MSSQELGDEAFSDIEEALAELFDAGAIYDGICEGATEEVQAIGEKVKRACFLLDRPWPPLYSIH